MITVYSPGETDFLHNGAGTLNALRCEVSETLNGEFVARLEVRSADAGSITDGAVVRCGTHRGQQLFRVVRVEKSLDGIVAATARHISYDLLGAMIEDRAPTGYTGAQALAVALDGTAFSGTSDISTTASCRWVRKNPIAALLGDDDNSFVNVWGGEVERDNYTINMPQRLGADRGVSIRYAKNLTGLLATSDMSAVITRIMPTGLQGDGQTVLELPEKYIDSDNIGAYPVVYTKHMHYGDIQVGSDAYPTEADALDALRAVAAAEFAVGIDLPAVTLDVRFVDLSQTIEYADFAVLERVYLGDTVHCYHGELGVDVSLRVTSVRWDALRNRYDDILLGQPRASIVQEISRQAAQIPGIMVEQTALKAAMDSAMALLGGPGTSYIRFLPDIAHPAEMLATDDPDPMQAVNVIRINSAGLGVSTTGIGGPYVVAITGAGLVATAITTGTLNAALVKAGVLSSVNGSTWINMETGALSLADGTLTFGDDGFAVDIKDEDSGDTSRVAIDGNGLSANRANVDALYTGPIYINNTAPTFTGARAFRLPPGTYDIPVYPSQPTGYAYWDNGITSIQQALDALPKWLDGAAVNIILHYSPIYGDVTIAGFFGSGSLTVTTLEDFVAPYGRANIGAVQINDCSARVAINYVAAKQITAENTPHVTVRGCAVNVSGGTGMLVNAGAYVHALLCEINASIGIRCRYSGSALSNDNKGDCTTAARADYGGHASLIGTRSYGARYTEYAGIITDSSSVPTHGSGYVPPPVPPQTTVQIAVSTSRSRKGTQWYGDGSDTTVGYGQFERGGQWYGCMTFAGLSALAGKTVLSARLQYTRRNGVGSSGAESITVYGYSAPTTLPTGSWATGSPVTLVGSGKATPGVPRGAAAWLEVNASDVQAIINGTAVGLALYTGSTGYGKGDGAGAANAPILEVTYR